MGMLVQTTYGQLNTLPQKTKSIGSWLHPSSYTRHSLRRPFRVSSEDGATQWSLTLREWHGWCGSVQCRAAEARSRMVLLNTPSQHPVMVWVHEAPTVSTSSSTPNHYAQLPALFFGQSLSCLASRWMLCACSPWSNLTQPLHLLPYATLLVVPCWYFWPWSPLHCWSLLTSGRWYAFCAPECFFHLPTPSIICVYALNDGGKRDWRCLIHLGPALYLCILHSSLVFPVASYIFSLWESLCQSFLYAPSIRRKQSETNHQRLSLRISICCLSC